MIVKDEADIILNTLENLFSILSFDGYVICDTGSSDNTKELIYEFMSKNGVFGKVIDVEWKDFATNRNIALSASYKVFPDADYTFIFDADDKINSESRFLTEFDKDIYFFSFGEEMSYYRPLLIKQSLIADKKVRFHGVVHEFLNFDSLDIAYYDTYDYFINSGRTGNRNKNPNKYMNDAVIMLNEKCKIDMNPKYTSFDKTVLLPRYLFYIARSFKDAGNCEMAIKYYKQHIENKNGWSEEKYVSCLELGKMYLCQNECEDAVKHFLKCIGFTENRIEHLVYLCDYYMSKDMYEIIDILYRNYMCSVYANKEPPKSSLFVENTLYNSHLQYYYICFLIYSKKYKEAYNLLKPTVLNDKNDYNINEKLFKLFNVSEIYDLLVYDKDTLKLFYSLDNHTFSSFLFSPNITSRKYMVSQHEKIWNHLFHSNKYLLTKYDSNIINNILKTNSMYDLFPETYKTDGVVFTITSCKRLPLFKQTMNSFIKHCTDLDKICDWICVDDNSSEEDRQEMAELYPFMEFIYLDEKRNKKGHALGMQEIYSVLLGRPGYKYWIHLEDDFLFYKNFEYITIGIQELETNQNVSQIMFNINYAERFEDYELYGEQIKPESFIREHVHEPHGSYSYRNNHYWPHYSLRPSILRVEDVLDVGDFKNKPGFEREYANRFQKKYKTGFFPCITSHHIGRQTAHTGILKNAYQLNSMKQF